MSATFRKCTVTLLLMFGAALCGCDSGMGPNPPDPKQPSLFGVWMHESGPFIPALDMIEAKALILTADGAGRVIFQDPGTKVLDSVRILHADNGKSLFIDFNVDDVELTVAYPTVVFDENMLQVVDAQNVIATFTRVDALPEELKLRASEIVRRYDDLPRPTNFTGLVIQGGDMHYSSTAGSIERIIAATGVVGAPIGGSLMRHILSAHPEGFWSHCGCGGSPEAKLQNTSGAKTLDTVHTGTDLNTQIVIRGMAYIADAGDLWLHGDTDTVGRVFLLVAAQREPDPLVKTIPFDTHLEGLTYHQGELWAIAELLTRSIVRINPATGELLETFEVPDEDVRWMGLSFDADGRMFMLGTTLAEKGVIAEVTLD